MVRKLCAVIVAIWLPALLYAQWSNDPTVNTVISDTSGMQVQPKIVVNENGESFISWFSHLQPPFDVYLQRLDADGNKLWAPGGLLISDKPTMAWTTDYGLVLDRDNNAVLVNQDKRTGASDVFAYRISTQGQFLWGNDGIQLTNDTFENLSPSAVVTETGDIVFAWRNYPEPGKVSIGLQRVSPAGQLKWGTGIQISDTMHNDRHALLRTEDDNIVVAWCRFSDPDSTMHIFVQKMDSSGSPLWAQAVQVDTGDLLPVNSGILPKLENDGSGGALVLWTAVYPSDANTVFVQHIDTDGSIQWPVNGIEVSIQYANSHSEADLCYLPANQESFVFWKEYHYDGYDNFGLYGQKLSASGTKVWGDSGKVFEPLSKDTMCWDIVVKKGQGNDVTVFYQKEFLIMNPADTSFQSNIIAMRLDNDGAYLWPAGKVTLSSAPKEKYDLVSSDFVHNQWICVWTDLRNSPEGGEEFDIYAQNINYDGTLGPLGIEETPQSNPPENLLVGSPNRATTGIAINYIVSARSPVTLTVYDLSGKLAQALVNGIKNPGSYTANWDARAFPAGVYFVRFATGDFKSTKKFVLMQ